MLNNKRATNQFVAGYPDNLPDLVQDSGNQLKSEFQMMFPFVCSCRLSICTAFIILHQLFGVWCTLKRPNLSFRLEWSGKMPLWYVIRLCSTIMLLLKKWRPKSVSSSMTREKFWTLRKSPCSNAASWARTKVPKTALCALSNSKLTDVVGAQEVLDASVPANVQDYPPSSTPAIVIGVLVQKFSC